MRATVHICILSHLIEQCQVAKVCPCNPLLHDLACGFELHSHFRIWQSTYVILQEMRIDAAQMASSQNCLCQELEFYQWDFVDFKSPIRSFDFKLFIGIEILQFFRS